MTLLSWQDFAGSLLGASVAILTFLLTELNKSRQEWKGHIHLLHRSIGAALENMSDIDNTIYIFEKDKITRMLKNVEQHLQNHTPNVCYAFVPLTHVFEFSEQLLNKFSGSGYIDILTIILINKSKDLRKIIDDMNRQFETSILMNNQITMSGLNPTPDPQNIVFKENLEQFRDQMLRNDFQNNARIYISLLIQAQIAVGNLEKWGIRKWKSTFSGISTDTAYEEISNFFEDELDRRKIKYQKVFKTPLLATKVQ